MSSPALSICIPCGGAAHYKFPLERVLGLYSHQAGVRPDQFEVILAFDGGMHEIDQASYPYHCAVTQTTRTSPHLAHRNHARNDAAALARGQFLFFPDADCIPGLHLVAHLIQAMQAEPDRALTPVTWGTGRPPPPQNEWWTCHHDPRVLRLFVRRDNVWPYTGYRATPAPVPLVEEKPKQPITEGYPCVSRKMWEVLGGFDEEYLGWGRNKEEFVLRLNQMVPYRLLQSVELLKQSHPGEKRTAAYRQADARFRQLQQTVRQWGPILRQRYETAAP